MKITVAGTAEKNQEEASELDAIVTLVSDRAEPGTYAKVEALLAQLAAQAETIVRLTAAKDDAYTERNRVVAVLSKLWPSHLARHPEEDTTWERDWMTIICLHSPVGQLTWHVHDSQRFLFAHLSEGAAHWDGHTTKEKYRRLESVSAEASQAALVALVAQLEDMVWRTRARRPKALVEPT